MPFMARLGGGRKVTNVGDSDEGDWLWWWWHGGGMVVGGVRRGDAVGSWEWADDEALTYTC